VQQERSAEAERLLLDEVDQQAGTTHTALPNVNAYDIVLYRCSPHNPPRFRAWFLGLEDVL